MKTNEELKTEIDFLKKSNKLLEEQIKKFKKESKKKEKKLRETCEFYIGKIALKPDELFKIFENMPQPVLITEYETGKIIYLNKHLENLMGHSFDEVKGKTSFELGLNKKQIRNKIIEGLENEETACVVPISFTNKNLQKYHTLIYSKLINNKKEFILSIIIDISEAHKVKKELKESKEFYENIIDNTIDAIYVLSKKGKIKFANNQHFNVFGRQEKEIIDHYFYEFIPKKELPVFLSILKKDPLEKEIRNFESNIYHKNGSLVPVEISGKLVKYNNKNIIIANITNISEKKLAENILKEDTKKFQLITESGIDSLFMVDKNANIIFVSKSQKNQYGWVPEEIEGESIFKIISPGNLNYLKEQMLEVFKDTEISFESEIVHKTEGNIPVEIRAKTVIFKGEKVAVGVMRNISEKKSEEKKKAALLLETISTRNFLRSIIDSTKDMIFAKDQFGKYVIVNKSYSEAFSLEPKDLIDKTDNDLMEILFCRAKNIEFGIFELQKIGNTLKEREKYTSFYNKIIMPDGVEKIFQTSKINIYTENNIFEASIFFAHDITRMIRAEDELINMNLNLEKIIEEKTKKLVISEDNFRKLYEKSSEAKIIFKKDGNILDINENACLIFGYTKHEFLKLNVKNLWKIDSSQTFTDTINSYKTIETTIYTKDSKQIPYETSFINVKYFNENAILASGRDIRERKEIQKKILNAITETEEKERKRFAADIHDGIGANLSSIKMYIDLILEEQIPKEDTKKFLVSIIDIINEAARQAREIANNIKPHELTNLGLKSSIENVFKKIIKTNKIKAFTDIQTNDIKLNENFSLTIYRIVNELINNSIKHSNAKNIYLNLYILPDRLEMEYKDDGDGFDIEKITSEKLGNGITNIKNRIKQVNGEIDIFSEIGTGTEIKINVNTKDFIEEN
jgi:PAS domain S-box-containing protein